MTSIGSTQSNSQQIQQILKRWRMHRNALLEIVAKIPESSAQWRPSPKGMTMLELLYHIAWTPDFFLSAVDGRETDPVPIPNSIGEARRLLAELTKEHEAAIAAYSDADLQKEVHVPILFVTEPAVEVLHRLVTHEAHHKGQLWLYARMLGIEPPFYVDLTV